MEMLRVRELMTEDLVTVLPETETAVAWDLMGERDLRHLIVVDEEGDLLGVVSHRDLLRNALIERADVPLFVERELLQRTRVRDVMVSLVLTAEPEQDAAEAARTLFDEKIGCLPVVEGRRVVGILTESDFVRWFAYGARPRREPAPEMAAAVLTSDAAWAPLGE
jgi:CBS domain-containing protein